MSKRGLLFILSGGNGAGKDTQAPLLASKMGGLGVETECLYGPKTNPFSSALRSAILSEETRPESHLAEALSYYSVHVEAAERIIVPMLNTGTSVVLNRGPEATLVYNVLGRGLHERYPYLLQIYDDTMALLAPDAVLLLDVPVEIGLKRAGQQTETDQFQEQSFEEHDRRRELYLDMARSNPKSWRVVDVSTDVSTAGQAVWNAVGSMVNARIQAGR